MVSSALSNPQTKVNGLNKKSDLTELKVCLSQRKTAASCIITATTNVIFAAEIVF